METTDRIPAKGEQIYEGKAKILYATADPDLLIHYFKDDASAFNAKKKGTIVNKGIMNNAVSTKIYEHLEANGVETHMVKKLSDREILTKKVAIVPVEVVVRNRVAGSLAKRMGKPEGSDLQHTIIEYYYKDDALDDPMINLHHITAFELATREEMESIDALALKINVLLVELFKNIGIQLVDYKLEFGRYKGKILLADEISPDSCRLWDIASGDKLDKDRFRFNLGKVEESYMQVVERICGA